MLKVLSWKKICVLVIKPNVSIHITMILCSETMIMWNENMRKYNEIMRSGFERMTSGVTSVIRLKFCTKSFENVHLLMKILPN